MDRYVIIALCYVLRLGCCVVMGWGLQRDEAASTDLDHSQVEKKPKGKYKKLIVCQSLG